MRTWDFFFPDVLPQVLGCPEPTVERALLRAAREFCDRARVWRADLDPISTVAGTADYDLSYPSQSDAVELVGAMYNGHAIQFDVVDGTSTADRNTGRGDRRLLTWDLRTVKMMPTPADSGGSIVITAILQPAETATGVPNDIGDSYCEEISDGALARLLAMNKTEWTNQMIASEKSKKFMDAIGTARKRAWKAHSNTKPRVRGTYF